MSVQSGESGRERSRTKTGVKKKQKGILQGSDKDVILVRKGNQNKK
jgi:hypothetical protein